MSWKPGIERIPGSAGHPKSSTARALRIAVHDHLAVGRDGVASLKALGLF
jgi:hypothetical protein